MVDLRTILGREFGVVSLAKDLNVVRATIQNRPKCHKYQVGCVNEFVSEHQASWHKTDCHED